MPASVEIVEEEMSARERQAAGAVRSSVSDDSGIDEGQVEEIIQGWMKSYLSAAHPELPRPGAVCPFVKPALDAGAIEVRSEVVPEHDPEPVVLEVTRRALTEFAETPLPGRENSLRALVLVFPGLLGSGHLIDDVHEVLKIQAVRAGLMLGQFHAECPEPSARNGDFAVNRSPVPLFAIRSMTVHDILFLHGDRDCFQEYVQRFGHLYRKDRRIDPAFRELHDRAIARFGTGTGRSLDQPEGRRSRCPVTGASD